MKETIRTCKDCIGYKFCSYYEKYSEEDGDVRDQCSYFDDKSNYIKRAKNTIAYDRRTALCVLKDLSHYMRPSLDMFGEKILTIKRDKFEIVRKKYLDVRRENET